MNSYSFIFLCKVSERKHFNYYGWLVQTDVTFDHSLDTNQIFTNHFQRNAEGVRSDG